MGRPRGTARDRTLRPGWTRGPDAPQPGTRASCARYGRRDPRPPDTDCLSEVQRNRLGGPTSGVLVPSGGDLSGVSDMIELLTSRSRALDYQRCPRARWWLHEASGTGFQPIKVAIPL